MRTTDSSKMSRPSTVLVGYLGTARLYAVYPRRLYHSSLFLVALLNVSPCCSHHHGCDAYSPSIVLSVIALAPSSCTALSSISFMTRLRARCGEKGSAGVRHEEERERERERRTTHEPRPLPCWLRRMKNDARVQTCCEQESAQGS